MTAVKSITGCAFAVFILCALAGTAPAYAGGAPGFSPPPSMPEIKAPPSRPGLSAQDFPEQGRIPVIVRLNVSPPDDPKAIRETQAAVLGRLSDRTGAANDDLHVKAFTYTPGMGIRITRQEFEILMNDPAVAGIDPDGLVSVD